MPREKPMGSKLADFRRLGREDAGAVACLERICFTLPWSEKQYQAALEQKSFAAFGLLQDQSLVAYLSLYHVAPEMEIVNIAVTPQERRKGHGRRLLAMLLQVAVKMGMQKISLEVRESNAAARALYESLGFRQSGRRRRYYPDNGEDALIYFLNLPAHRA